MHGPVAYTDGACLGNPGPGGWGVRILHADGTVCELGGRAAATTNNRMELQAAIAALQVLHTSPQVAIFTDSRYVIDGLTKWLPAWRRRGWVTSTNTPVKNRDLWMTLEGLITLACAGSTCMGIAVTRTMNAWTPLPVPVLLGHVHRSSAARAAHPMIPSWSPLRPHCLHRRLLRRQPGCMSPHMPLAGRTT